MPDCNGVASAELRTTAPQECCVSRVLCKEFPCENRPENGGQGKLLSELRPVSNLFHFREQEKHLSTLSDSTTSDRLRRQMTTEACLDRHFRGLFMIEISYITAASKDSSPEKPFRSRRLGISCEKIFRDCRFRTPSQRKASRNAKTPRSML